MYPLAAALLLPAVAMASAPHTMRAIVPHDGRCAVKDVDVPRPGSGEILVRVHTTAVNRADTLQRKCVPQIMANSGGGWGRKSP